MTYTKAQYTAAGRSIHNVAEVIYAGRDRQLTIVPPDDVPQWISAHLGQIKDNWEVDYRDGYSILYCQI